MLEAVARSYRRVPGVARALPAVALLPFLGELAQHAAEVHLGLFASGGALDPHGVRVRLLFGALKVVLLLVALVLAIRWWRFEGDAGRAVRPTAQMAKGLGIALAVLLGGEGILGGIGYLIYRVLPVADGAGRLVAFAVPLAAWAVILALILPWIVGLVAEDRTMTLRRSLRGTKGHVGSTIAIYLAGFLPAMAVHYLLNEAAMRRDAPALWALLVLDAAVVALLALALASTYYTVYRRAAARAPLRKG
jgi:hypothetical protein